MIPKRLSRKKIFSSPILDLFLDRVKFSSGHIVEDYHFLKLENDPQFHDEVRDLVKKRLILDSHNKENL